MRVGGREGSNMGEAERRAAQQLSQNYIRGEKNLPAFD